MTFRGKIKNGAVVLDQPVPLPDGAEVEITPTADAEPLPPTWAEVFKDFIGKAEGLPSDSSINHDHYLHGAPKR